MVLAKRLFCVLAQQIQLDSRLERIPATSTTVNDLLLYGCRNSSGDRVTYDRIAD